MIYNVLGKSNLEVSSIGFGSYRINNEIHQHQEALEFSLRNGINLIDTSSNYTDGESEILIGNTINKLISDGMKRENFIIVSKGGYIQGKNLQLVNERKIKGNPYKDIVNCSPDLMHSINPEFLSDQIDLSNERLQTNYIDVYLLHNPEYFLSYTRIDSPEELRTEYYRRIKEAFTLLEKKVTEGKIKWYGISSNTFGSDSNDLNFTSLEKVIEIADSISENNHFTVVQFPLNIIEKKNASTKNQKNNSLTFLELAKMNSLGVLVNRPLNAIIKNKLIRLADFEIKENISKKEMLELALKISDMEKSIANLTEIISDDKLRANISDCLSSCETIITNFEKFNGVSHFKEIRNQYFIPRANYALKNLHEFYKEDKSKITMMNNYAVHLNILLDSCESVIAKEANLENEILHKELNNYLPEENHLLPFSQKSILMINSLEYVTCTLVGMRKVEYVKDVLSIFNLKLVSKAHEYWGLD